MLIFLLQFFITILLCLNYIDAKLNNCLRSTATTIPGIGTVLYSSADIRKQCWSQDEIALLTTRMVLEDLLPDKSILRIDSCSYVDDLVEYFKLLVDTVRKSTYGRKKHITLIALADLLGGYLHHAVLPIARHAFYAGLVDYNSMEKLIELFEELKWFLRTNGQGWGKPIENMPDIDIQPINIQTEAKSHNNKSCCSKLIYYQHNVVKGSCPKNSPTREVLFPMPFFDSKVKPSAIAIPFKRYALRNIETRKATHSVFKFFVSGSKCLQELKATPGSTSKFQNNLFGWIEKEALPKLKDDKFYSAFGSILRVRQSIKEMGGTIPETSTCEGEYMEEEVKTGPPSHRSSAIVWTMLIIIFIWFVIGTVFICYRMRRNQADGKSWKKSYASSTSSDGSKSRWSLFTRSSTKNTTDRTISGYNTSSSDYDYRDINEKSKKGKRNASCPVVCYPPNKPPLYLDDKPAIIDTKHSMKMLPSIAEISENSSMPKDERMNKSKTISFGDKPGESNSNLPKCGLLKFVPCSKYSKTTSFSSSRGTVRRDLGTHMSDGDECWCGVDFDEALEAHKRENKGVADHSEERLIHKSPLAESTRIEEPHEQSVRKQEVLDRPLRSIMDSTAGETTDDTGVTANSPHVYACHSSLTGDYTKDKQGAKRYAFGYDFQTSSSSDISDEDTDIRTSTSK